MNKIAAITLTRTPELFRRLTGSLGGAPFDLNVVVNNGQSEELIEFAIKNGWATLNPRTNLSFSEGNNLAAKVAIAQGCDYLLLLNDDVIANEDFVKGVKLFTDYAEPILGFRITDDGTVNHDGTMIARTPEYLGCATHINRGGAIDIADPTIAVVPAVTFAAVLIDAKWWAKTGGLDEGFVYGWEDTDLCLRAMSEGGTVRVMRDISVEHSECGTRLRGSKGDLENVKRFRDRWIPRIPVLLDEYEARHPDAEGLGIVVSG